MNKLQHILPALMITGTLLMIGSCRKQYEATEIHMADYGWLLYEKAEGTADYRNSNEWFLSSMNEDSTYMDSYNGLGWTYGKLTYLDSSIIFFTKGLKFQESIYDTTNIRQQVWAGLCFAYNAYGNDALSIQFGDSLIVDLSSGLTTRSWIFNHNNINSKNKIDHLDVRVTLAASNFAVSEFSNSVLHIQTILDGLSNSGTFEPDVNTVQGRAELALWIDSLQTILSSR